MSMHDGKTGLPQPLGWWRPDSSAIVPRIQTAAELFGQLHRQLFVVATDDGPLPVSGGLVSFSPGSEPTSDGFPILAVLPAVHPALLGDRQFLADHNLQFPYMTGAMANGIGSVEIVEAMGHAGMLGSYGAAGQSIQRVAEAIDRLQSSLGEKLFAVNLIHSPNEPRHEEAMADLLLEKQVRLVEASAFLDLSAAVVRYRVAGLEAGPDGEPVCRNRIIAKVSRVEVATRFLMPPPDRIVQELLAQGAIRPDQAAMARHVPMCDDLTAEADSGGHTDNRPAITLLPTLIALRDRIARETGMAKKPRVGLAGGIATPDGVAAAFSMGAGYVVTGSINQACVESGSSDAVRKMLAEAEQADTIMAPAADMFEMGVKLQVLKRGTMFAMRAGKLYELYRQYPSWQAIPAADRGQLEKTVFRTSYEQIWAQTRDFWLKRDPSIADRAETDLKHQMALVFRWYLGMSSRWANAGESGRQIDYQVWCGPAMGAFNEWARGSFLENPSQRSVVALAYNLLYGAGLRVRQAALRQQGVEMSDDFFPVRPLPVTELQRRLLIETDQLQPAGT